MNLILINKKKIKSRIYKAYRRYILIDNILNIFVIFVVELRFDINKMKNIIYICFEIFGYKDIILNLIDNYFALIILINNDTRFFNYVLRMINIYCFSNIEKCQIKVRFIKKKVLNFD